MCVTKSKKIYEKMRVLRDHGMSKERKYWHDVVGYNYRLTNLQAAIGVGQLERIKSIIDARRKVEDRYRRYLSGIDMIEFQKNNLPHREKVTWLVSILIKGDRKDKCVAELRKAGIDVRLFFYPLSHMRIYEKYVHSNKISSEISRMGVNLPTHTNLDERTFKKIRKVIIKNK